MSVTAHVAELKRKHQILSDEVEKALRSPSANDFEITEMKKQKLKIKEQIARLTH